MTRIGIIRHGSTAWNKEGRIQGRMDIPLDEDGIVAAERLGERLCDEKWHFIYSSNLSRAKRTAEIINDKLGNIPLQTDDRIREAGFGLLEGTTIAERVEKWGANWREMDFGAESSHSVVSRGISFFDELLERHPNQNVLVVSHGSFIRQMLGKLVPHSIKEGHIKNTSITKIFKKENGWDCDLYNCTIHLDNI